MGLKYVPAESKKLVAEIEQKIQLGREIVSRLDYGSKKLADKLGGPTLSGKAYTAGKNMMSEEVIPLIVTSFEGLDKYEDSLRRYKESASVVGNEPLDEDDLQEELELWQAQLIELGLKITKYQALSVSAAEKGMSHLSTKYANMEQDFSRSLVQTEESVHAVQAKLQKLYTFNTAIAGLFGNSLTEFKQIVTRAFNLGLLQFDESQPNGYAYKTLADIPGDFVDTLFSPIEWAKAFIFNGHDILSVGYDIMEKYGENGNVGEAIAYEGVGAIVNFATSAFLGAMTSALIAELGVGTVPVWASLLAGVAVGVAISVAFETAYDFVPWFKDGVDTLGDGMNWTVDRVGDGFNWLVDTWNGLGDALGSNLNNGTVWYAG